MTDAHTPRPTPEPGGAAPGRPLIRQGACHALFAYDIALAIDLAKAARSLADCAPADSLRGQRRAPRYFNFEPAPLHVVRPASPIALAGRATEPSVECVLWDFGAVSVRYRAPIDGPLADLLPLSEALYNNEALLADSRRHVLAIAAAIAPALSRPAAAEVVEDYVIYEIDDLDAGPSSFSPSSGHSSIPPQGPTSLSPHGQSSLSPPSQSPLSPWGRGQGEGSAISPSSPLTLIEQNALLLAQILRSESRTLSEQEVVDALSSRISYSDADAALIDWNAAILFQRDSEDVRAVLEYVNVELLEMRFLDNLLDGSLDQAYQTLARRENRRFFRESGFRADLQRVARLQMDSALLFEGVNNALKLVGDQYLARVYRLASERLHLPEWDASIIRKLAVLDGIYQKAADRQTTRRMEVLEWIIILLIAFEIVWSVAPAACSRRPSPGGAAAPPARSAPAAAR